MPSCPLMPGLHAFGVDVQLADDYEFTTIIPSLKVLSADIPTFNVICLNLQVTPQFGTAIDVSFSIVPLAIVLLVGFATLLAAVYNPWVGTTDLLRATSNYGQDPDALRLVTPGIADIWYYIQFAVYTACLSLDYPGFYQPVLSRVGWSNLLFNTTLLHPSGNGTLSWSTVTSSLTGQFDNSSAYIINVVNSSDYGMTQYASLVGIPAKDVWPTFMVWFLLVLAGITILTELAFALYWVYRYTTGEHTVDFGSMNICFLGGMILRIWSLFYIVIVTLSCYQIVITGQSPKFQVGLSIVSLLLLGIVAPLGLFWIISRYRPREHLYDDLQVLLVLGPLYNTYQPSGLLFLGVVFLIRLIQGIVIGAAQGSGVAQITLLATLEIAFLVAVNVWRPYHPRTSMNGWHTFMAVIRLIVILFLVAFVPSLGVDDGVRGWIGYTVLVLHGVVLVFIFLLNVVITILEMIARLVGAGEDSARRERDFGLANVFGINQLMKRGNSTTHHHPRDIDYVDDTQERKVNEMTLAQRRLSRNSSQGGSSGYGLMDATSYPSRGSTPGGTGPPLSPHDRRNTMSPVSAHSGGQGYFARAATNGQGSTSTNGNGNANNAISPSSTFSAYTDSNTFANRPAYYRPPRRSHGSLAPLVVPGGPLLPTGTSTRYDPAITPSRTELDTAVRSAFTEGLDDIRRPASRTDSPRPASRNEQKPRPNYAVREADAFYYRRPDYSQPLNAGVATGRKLGTGPADPTGPVAVASSWLGRMFRGNPEKGKFEVVRGTAARATEIPLTEKAKDPESRSSTAGKGEDVRSPLVTQGPRIVEEEEHDDNPVPLTRESEDIPTTPVHPPVIPELDMGQRSIDLPRPTASTRAPMIIQDSDDDLAFPLPPPKHPNRGSVSSIESLENMPNMSPPVPRKSSARGSPVITTQMPWRSSGEQVRHVTRGRAIWTEQNARSRESVGEVRDSAGEYSSDDE